jgi:hypothetical protein
MEKNIDPNAKVGMRIHLLKMYDDTPVEPNTQGTIRTIDSLGTLHVAWDNGSSLGVIPGLDEYQLLPPENEQVDFDIFESKEGTLSSSYTKESNKAFSKNKLKIKSESEKIKGGVSDNKTIEDLAKKHKTSVEKIKSEIKMGIEVELEHTKSKVKAKEIAMDHVFEFPDYYSNKKYGVKNVEKELKKIHENISDEFKTHLQKIVNTIKTINFNQKPTVEKMIDNFYQKYKGKVDDDGKLLEIVKNLKSKLEDRFGVDETSTAGGVSTGAFVGPIKIKEGTTMRNTDYTTGTSSGNDMETWSNKKDGWRWNDKPIWKGGEIVDILAKIKTVWDDSNLDVSKDLGKLKITESETLEEEDEQIDETTTTASVWVGVGPPVGPAFAARKGQWRNAKKPLWKGGTIVQDIKNDDVLNPVNEGFNVLDEVNKIKWVKGGKYVKIKDRCADFNNKPWCNQGAIDKPLELSNTTFENIKRVSEKMGISEEVILEKIRKSKLNK